MSAKNNRQVKWWLAGTSHALSNLTLAEAMRISRWIYFNLKGAKDIHVY